MFRPSFGSRTCLLGAASTLALFVSTSAHAQEQSVPGQTVSTDTVGAPGDEGEEIVITGIRASQAAAVNIKREANSVVDAISAEDIGKLPDITISDSLQRIPGVQIRRTAGEGGSVNVRGLPQVQTLLNGEAFLGAQSITTVQPNFTDIPSQLFAGAEVIKSPTADLLQAGITGTINLLTRRPFDLDNGITASAAAEAVYGDRTEKWNPQVNGLLAWRNEDFGALISASYSDVDLSNSYRGIQREYGGRLANESLADATASNGFRGTTPGRGTLVAGGVDVNGDGDASDAFFAPQSHTGWNRITSRERLGINGSIQARLSDSLEFVADGFYTRQTQYDRTAGFQFQMVNWQAADFTPAQFRDTGAVTSDGFNFNTVQQYDYTLNNFDSYSQTNRTVSESKNFNAELRYNNDSAFRVTLRGLYADANLRSDDSYAQFSPSDGFQWFGGVGNYPASIGGDRLFNPGGYRVQTLPATVDYSGDSVAFTLPSQLQGLLADPARYALKTVSSENNRRANSDFFVLRADAAYDVSPGFNIEFGLRYGERFAEDFYFERAAPFYAGQGATDPQGCFVKWKAFDVRLNAGDCQAPDGAGDFYTAGLVRPATDPAFNGQVRQFETPAGGVGPIYALDPRAMDDALGFQESFYPGNQEFVIPGRSYDIRLKQWSGYVQLNFETELAGLPIRGNGGVKIIDTRFTVRQNLSGPGQQYGLPAADAGDLFTDQHFTDYLPNFNVAADFTDNLRLRLAFARTMTLLDLQQWGGGLDLNYAIDTTFTPPLFRVSGGNSNGNPELDPWRATNVEASLEYYFGSANLLSVGVFNVSVESFIERSTIIRNDLPDLDGVIRRPIPIGANVQGEGGTLRGIEAGAKVALDFLPGALGGFGVDLNYTLSDSTSGNEDLAGNAQPFQDNSRHQANAALWFERYGLQARVAYNFRSKRVEESNFGGITGLTLYQEPTHYIDASIGYDITPNLTVYGQATNLTGEYERYYLTFDDLRAFDNIYERRFLAGVRARF